ncbi:Transposase DDE domain protein [compost metagenome]
MENASLSNIPQLSYRLLHQQVLQWLSGLNPRRVQACLPLVAAFMAGLLWVRGAVTCTAIAAGGAFSHDALNRLLIGPALQGWLQMAALTMVNRMGGYLVIDDVVLDKTGRKIQGIHRLFSSSLDTTVLALNVVVMGWTNGKVFIPLTFRFWKPPREKGSRLAFDGTPFRTKIELAIEMLGWARSRGFKPTAVLFDAYYLADPVVARLKKFKWQWVSRLKSNRVLLVDGMKLQLKRWDALAEVGWARHRGASERCVLPGWGEARVIALVGKHDKEPRYLIGSNPEWGRGRIISLYGHRWDIEVSFRNTKQLVGLGDCQCRSFRAQENHVALVMLGYLFVLAQARPKETAGDVIGRVKGAHAVISEIRSIQGVRPIKLQRRRGRRGAHEACASVRAA